MTPEELKNAVDNNLKALAEVVLVLEPKVKFAEELISKTIKGLSQYPFLFRAKLTLDVDINGEHQELKIYGSRSDLYIELNGADWDELSPRDKLRLADMLPSVTAHIGIEAGKVVNEFPTPSKPVAPSTINLPGDDAPSDEQPQAKRRWYLF